MEHTRCSGYGRKWQQPYALSYPIPPLRKLLRQSVYTIFTVDISTQTAPQCNVLPTSKLISTTVFLSPLSKWWWSAGKVEVGSEKCCRLCFQSVKTLARRPTSVLQPPDSYKRTRDSRDDNRALTDSETFFDTMITTCLQSAEINDSLIHFMFWDLIHAHALELDSCRNFGEGTGQDASLMKMMELQTGSNGQRLSVSLAQRAKGWTLLCPSETTESISLGSSTNI